MTRKSLRRLSSMPREVWRMRPRRLKARAILTERLDEDADLKGALRDEMWSSGRMASTVRPGKKIEGEKFKDYFDFSEPLHKLPSHRILALFRGEKEEILDLQIEPQTQARPAGVPSSYELK